MPFTGGISLMDKFGRPRQPVARDSMSHNQLACAQKIANILDHCTYFDILGHARLRLPDFASASIK